MLHKPEFALDDVVDSMCATELPFLKVGLWFGATDMFDEDETVIENAWHNLFPKPIIGNYATIFPSDVEGLLALSIVREVQPRQVRGRVNRIMPRMIGISRYYATPGFKFKLAYREIVYGLVGGKLIALDIDGENLMSATEPVAAISNGMIRQAQAYWRLQFSVGDSPRTETLVDGDIIKQVLKEREVTPGKLRRDALRHLVRGHKRILSSTGEVQEIREHLRGKSVCFWNGMRVDIIEPDLDAMRHFQKVTQAFLDKERREQDERNTSYSFDGVTLPVSTKEEVYPMTVRRALLDSTFTVRLVSDRSSFFGPFDSIQEAFRFKDDHKLGSEYTVVQED